MQRIKNVRLATQGIAAVLLFGIAFAASGAEQMMRALPAPATAVPAAVQSTAVPVAQPPGSPAKPMSQSPADAPTSRMKQAPQASPNTTIPTPVALLPNLWLGDGGVRIGGTFVPYVSIGTPTLRSSVMIQSPNGIKGEGCRFPLSFNVKNDGGGPTSSSFDVKVEIAQEQRTVSSTVYAMNQLNPGATETENTGFEVLPGTYTFLLTIDPYHRVKQANPGDKQYRIMFNARCGEGNTSTLAPAALGGGSSGLAPLSSPTQQSPKPIRSLDRPTGIDVPAPKSVIARPGSMLLPDLAFSHMTVEQTTYDGQAIPQPIVVRHFVAPPSSNKKKRDGLLPSDDLSGLKTLELGCDQSFTFPLQLIVKNIGQADFVPKGSFQAVSVNVGSWGGAKDIVRLSSGQSQVMKFNVTLPPGKYTLEAMIDLKNEVAEARTDNNKLSWPLEVTCEVNRNEVRKLNK